ncbi:DUF1439 domain-containing protein [Ramlibacter sp. 2FC]|uniref:DUF1439 domain-containing protein n=1 Tax=Ramlibacter sp. 2FC TaxID=2502188 RepID=UPI0010F7C01B|nr:DUF1439 domain-containing protein [Ramlibacter sp. 2FC]
MWMNFKRVALPCLALLLAACAALQPEPRVVEISEARLAALIAREFPRQGRYLEVFDIALDAPRLKLMPEENRIATQLPYRLGGPLTGGRAYTGLLQLSYGLRYEPSDSSVRLADVRVEEFQLAGLPPAQQSRAGRLGGLLAQDLLQDFPIHRFRPEDLQQAGRRGLQPGELRVVPGGLQLHLVPVERP